MSEGWRELERTAERLRELSRNSRLSYDERRKLEQDAERIGKEARKQRQAYVNWLWGYG